MSQQPKYYLIEQAILPEVFLKVVEVKRLLATGEETKVSSATRRVGLSRSAFYKYKDSILPFQNLMAGRIVTFQMTLHDTVGLLGRMLTMFSAAGANILTINQTIPVDATASVTITASTTQLACTLEELLHRITELDGVYKAEILAG